MFSSISNVIFMKPFLNILFMKCVLLIQENHILFIYYKIYSTYE
jgi:hypothetical protein